MKTSINENFTNFIVTIHTICIILTVSLRFGIRDCNFERVYIAQNLVTAKTQIYWTYQPLSSPIIRVTVLPFTAQKKIVSQTSVRSKIINSYKTTIPIVFYWRKSLYGKISAFFRASSHPPGYRTYILNGVRYVVNLSADRQKSVLYYIVCAQWRRFIVRDRKM